MENSSEALVTEITKLIRKHPSAAKDASKILTSIRERQTDPSMEMRAVLTNAEQVSNTLKKYLQMGHLPQDKLLALHDSFTRAVHALQHATNQTHFSSFNDEMHRNSTQVKINLLAQLKAESESRTKMEHKYAEYCNGLKGKIQEKDQQIKELMALIPNEAMLKLNPPLDSFTSINSNFPLSPRAEVEVSYFEPRSASSHRLPQSPRNSEEPSVANLLDEIVTLKSKLEALEHLKDLEPQIAIFKSEVDKIKAIKQENEDFKKKIADLTAQNKLLAEENKNIKNNLKEKEELQRYKDEIGLLKKQLKELERTQKAQKEIEELKRATETELKKEIDELQKKENKRKMEGEKLNNDNAELKKTLEDEKQKNKTKEKELKALRNEMNEAENKFLGEKSMLLQKIGGSGSETEIRVWQQQAEMEKEELERAKKEWENDREHLLEEMREKEKEYENKMRVIADMMQKEAEEKARTLLHEPVGKINESCVRSDVGDFDEREDETANGGHNFYNSSQVFPKRTPSMKNFRGVPRPFSNLSRKGANDQYNSNEVWRCLLIQAVTIEEYIGEDFEKQSSFKE